MLSILGSLDLTSLVPATYRASGSLVLQTTLIFGVIFVVTKIISFIKYRLETERIFGKLPGPKERNWLHGNFVLMRGLDAHDRLMKFVEWTNTFSKERGFIRVWGPFWRPTIMTCHPSSMKKILKTAEPKPLHVTSGYRTLRDWLGDGLLISGGNKWARNRRLLTPAFHFDILKPYIDVFNNSADILIDKLGKFADEKKQFEIFQQICLCTLDIILKCAFSYEIDVQRSGESHPYVLAVKDLTYNNTMRLRNPLLAPDIIFYRTKNGKKFKKDCDFVHGVAQDVINKRRRVLAKLDTVKERKYLDFLDILLTAKDENGVGLSDIEIRNEVDTFLFEGHDTTASAISWILYSLAEHPDYQKKCQEEIDDMLSNRETDDIEWSDLPKLEYLTMCIKEGMRLHSPVGIVARETTKPLDLGDTVLPPKTIVSINIWALHHNEHVWGPDHMEYKPERFSKDKVTEMDPYQFVPFSGGPSVIRPPPLSNNHIRKLVATCEGQWNCIGQNFAMSEEKVVIAKLLHNFTFSLVPDHEVRRRLSAVMKAENGLLAHVRRRRD